MAVLRKHVIALLVALSTINVVASDFSRGILLVCEGQYGADYGSLAFLGEDGSRVYRAFSKQNPGHYLGTTSQSGYCSDGKIYIVSKEPAGGGVITSMEASSLKYINALTELPGRTQAFYLSAVSPEKGYLSTSEGLYIIDLECMEVTGRVAAPELSPGMFGQSLVLDGKLFVVSRRNGIVVVEIATDEVIKIIPVSGAMAVTCSDSGRVFVGTTDSTGEVVEISSADLSARKIDIGGIDASMTDVWESWTLQPFVYDDAHGALLIARRYASTVGRYDPERKEYISDFIKLPSATGEFDNSLYGQGISMNPYDGSVTIIAAEASGDYFNDCFMVYSADSMTGELIPDKTVEMPEGYWFPAQVLYPGAVSSLASPITEGSELTRPVVSPDGRVVLADAVITDVMNLPPGIYIFGNRKIAVR